ncbi:multi-sensor signal transduction histidine kinase [Candidatus Vecturithrix granuli]|uniref:histidine kinase n=1 Tax=Vecturithrix granuli TaxID=1499967 RepID=A0A081BYD7_VECG1|nr:multi-sensor signal transduction histidine kinase [Candidatus Vecturithrix granuli]
MDKPDDFITVGCHEDDVVWIFSVADNGPGIDRKYYEKICQIFQTLTPRDDYKSEGIGLAIVKKIVELHGRKIWLESTPGKGSSFFFTLPRNLP